MFPESSDFVNDPARRLGQFAAIPAPMVADLDDGPDGGYSITLEFETPAGATIQHRLRIGKVGHWIRTGNVGHQGGYAQDVARGERVYAWWICPRCQKPAPVLYSIDSSMAVLRCEGCIEKERANHATQ